jgi:hypothetical protein
VLVSIPPDGVTPDIMASLQGFSQRAEASVGRLRDLQSQIDALVPPTLPTAVRAEMGADGLLTQLTIVRDVAPAELEHEIGLAITDAARRRPALDPAQAQAPFRVAAQAGELDLGRILEQLFSGQDPTAHPAPHHNAEHTVAVTAQSGVVQRVECDHAWLERTSREGVAAEVLDTVNQAISTSSTTPGGN